MINSPQIADTLVNDNKRYIRFSAHDEHPAWLGYQDRYLFPAYEKDPSYFFIRKMNIHGNMFQEKELLSYIREKHFDNPIIEKCSIEDASVVPQCLELFARRLAQNNEIIIIPTNMVPVF